VRTAKQHEAHVGRPLERLRVRTHGPLLEEDSELLDVELSGHRGRRMAWSVSDQILSSATNFVLTILVARAVSPGQLGVFAVLMAVYLVVNGIVRGLTSEVVAVRLSSLSRPELAAQAGGALGLAASAGIIVGSVVLIGGAVVASMGGDWRPVVVLGLAFPLLIVQDALRFVFVAQREAVRAFAIDLVWAIVQIAAIIAVVAVGDSGLTIFMAAWAFAGALSAVVGLIINDAKPKYSAAREWLRLHRDLAAPFVVEFLAGQGAYQLSLISAGAIAGLSTAGALRGVQALFGPLTVLSAGLALAAIPEFARLAKRGAPRFTLACVGFGVVIALGALVTGVLMMALPEQAGHALLGESWALASPLIIFLTIQKVGEGIGIGAFVGMRSRQYAFRSAGLRSAIGVLAIATSSLGAYLAGAKGVMIGMAIVMPLAAVAWWLQFLRASKVEAAGSAKTPGGAGGSRATTRTDAAMDEEFAGVSA